MVKTWVASALLNTGTAPGTSTVFTVSGGGASLGHTPAVGNIVVVQLQRLTGVNAAGLTTPPAGWETLTPATYDASPTAQWRSECFWKQIDGTEGTTATFTYPNSSSRVVVQEGNESSMAGLKWAFDSAAHLLYVGPGATGNSQNLGSTGTLADASSFVVTSLGLSGSTGTTTPSISDGFTRIHGGNIPSIFGYKVPGAVTALSPTYGWVTSRNAVVGQVAPFHTVPAQDSDSMLLMFGT